MRGRYPKPTKLKLLEGNPGRRKLPADEPQFEVGAPVKPGHLSPRVATEWDRIVALLTDKGVLTVADGDAVETYCTWLVIHREAIAKLESGDLMPRQYVKVFIQAKQAAEIVHKFAVQFGITPASRPRVHSDQQAKKTDTYGEFKRTRA